MRRAALAAPLLLLGACGGEPAEVASDEAPRFFTWPPVEPDKCASVWLYRTHVDAAAQFDIVDKPDLLDGSEPFDTPDSPYRRQHDAATFEVVVREHSIEDPTVELLAEIIHDLEVTPWGPPRHELSPQVGYEISQIARGEEPLVERFDRCTAYFESLARTLGEEGGA